MKTTVRFITLLMTMMVILFSCETQEEEIQAQIENSEEISSKTSSNAKKTEYRTFASPNGDNATFNIVNSYYNDYVFGIGFPYIPKQKSQESRLNVGYGFIQTLNASSDHAGNNIAFVNFDEVMDEFHDEIDGESIEITKAFLYWKGQQINPQPKDGINLNIAIIDEAWNPGKITWNTNWPDNTPLGSYEVTFVNYSDTYKDSFYGDFEFEGNKMMKFNIKDYVNRYIKNPNACKGLKFSFSGNNPQSTNNGNFIVLDRNYGDVWMVVEYKLN